MKKDKNKYMALAKTVSQTTLLICILVAVVVGFLIGNLSSGHTFSKTASKPTAGSLYSSQQATINGKITKVSGNTLTVTSSKGTSSDVELSGNVVINKFLGAPDKIKGATSSTDLKTIDLDKDATITLQSTDGTNYKVVAIGFTPPQTALPSLPPVPKK